MKTEIKVTNDSKKPNKNGLYSLKLRIKNKLGRQTKSIGVTVGKDIWDETKGHLKNQYWADYSELVEYINAIYRNRKKVEVPLNKGLMTRLTAHEILTDKNIVE